MYWIATGLTLLVLHAASFRSSAPITLGSATAPVCETIEAQEVMITCTYTATPRSSNPDRQRIVLNRAVLSFGTKRDGFMFVDLTFTNEGASISSASHTVFLTIDDEEGHNMLRRVLPKVDFRKLPPGSPVTFSERFLVGGFRRGRYAISLLIPNPDPSLKNNPASNILLNNEGVANPATGLNTIAHFTVGP